MSTTSVPDFSSCITTGKDGQHSLRLLVEGMRCASCAFMIEHLVNAHSGVTARVNVTEKRLSVSWKGDKSRFLDFLAPVLAHGYGLKADEGEEGEAQKKEERFLLLCLAVAGFAAGNIMLLSVGLWASTIESMGLATRDVLHWFSAAISLPTVLFAGQPFFRSAWSVLKNARTNMDVPISLAVLLCSGMSVFQTLTHQEHAFFDSAVMLLFFLLIGRYLDFRMRRAARSAASDLLLMMHGEASVMVDGALKRLPLRDIHAGMQLHVAAGEKILADGVVVEGASEIDASLLTGETLPQEVAKGAQVYAGMINLAAPLIIRVSAEKNESLLSGIIRLMEQAEQSQAKYVRLADKIARAYTPAVHALALSSFLGWLLLSGMGWQHALMIAVAVLIITCPCALGLAVPVVQVIATSLLYRRGILVKTGDALERMADIDTVVFDKTGTLTKGRPRLQNAAAFPAETLALAARLAASSRHPLSRALVAAVRSPLAPLPVKEIAGQGLEAVLEGKTMRLGKRSFCGVETGPEDRAMELWFADGAVPIRFIFEDEVKEDTATTLEKLKALGLILHMFSGDRTVVAEALGKKLGLESAKGAMTPQEKHEALKAMQESGRRILYVGDGLNDAAALAAALASMSPASGMDIAQNAADMVFQGDKLAPVLMALRVARFSQNLVKQNFVLSLAYNLLAVPLAVAGLVTPLLAALAMSSSSIIVILNALRLKTVKI